MAEAAVLARRLLPSGATPFERAHLAAQIAAWPLDRAAMARQSNPNTCDEAWLPFLFFDGGGVVWSDAWPVTKKRRVVGDLLIYKRLEGTPAGVEAYLNLADALVLRETLPPANSFALDDTGLTYAQIRALMPELRLLHHWPATFKPHAGFADGYSFADRAFAQPDILGPRGRYPVLYDHGVETPLGVADAESNGDIATLVYAGLSGHAPFADRAFADQAFLVDPMGGKRLTFDLIDPEITYHRISPPLRMDVATTDRTFADAAFILDDEGASGSYDRLILNDPSRIPTSLNPARAAAFADEAWGEIPPHEIILTAAIPGSPAVVRQRQLFADTSFASDPNPDHLAFVMRAANAARRAGDRILISPAPSARAATAPALPNLDLELAA